MNCFNLEIFFSNNIGNPFVSFGTQTISIENFNVTYGYFLNVFGTLAPPTPGVRMQIRIGSLFSNIYTIT
jgi:hypothetical protein